MNWKIIVALFVVGLVSGIRCETDDDDQNVSGIEFFFSLMLQIMFWIISDKFDRFWRYENHATHL